MQLSAICVVRSLTSIQTSQQVVALMYRSIMMVSVVVFWRCVQKVEKLDNKTLVIREVPFTKTANTLQESITKGCWERQTKDSKSRGHDCFGGGDSTSSYTGTSSDKTIDALYAFTDCVDKHFAKLLCHPRQQTRVLDDIRCIAQFCRTYEGFIEVRVRDSQAWIRGTVVL